MEQVREERERCCLHWKFKTQMELAVVNQQTKYGPCKSTSQYASNHEVFKYAGSCHEAEVSKGSHQRQASS